MFELIQAGDVTFDMQPEALVFLPTIRRPRQLHVVRLTRQVVIARQATAA